MDRPNLAPPVAAVFIVIFDLKVGYTIARKRTLPDIDLDGVEYKSLPSGLHAVPSDLIYFVHDGRYAGISCFIQASADAAQRHASFVAVGCLVSLDKGGQLGRSWMHAEELRTLAKEVVKDTSDTRHLELFWKKHRADENLSRSLATVNAVGSPTAENRKRKRAPSEATLAGFKNDGQVWPKDHPALAIPALFESFGPLIFPLQRAALLRKRVLFLGSTPVQKNCNTVYSTSVLSTIPTGLRETLPAEAENLVQCRPLFSVGIQEMDLLADRTGGENIGWLACTTDDILGEKKDMYDLLVDLPGTTRSKSPWPVLRTSDGKIIKASQRDLRRWQQLRRELQRLRRQTIPQRYTDDPNAGQIESEEQPLLRRATSEVEDHTLDATSPAVRLDENEVVESTPWSALAYRGFMWWASAGEASAWENDQAQADEELLFDLPDVAGILALADDIDGDDEEEEDETTNMRKRDALELHFARAAATIIVTYFRRITENILKPMTSIVEEADDETEEGIAEDPVTVSLDHVGGMGLDTWSADDKAFVVEMLRVWYDREAVITGGGVRVCGVRIC